MAHQKINIAHLIHSFGVGGMENGVVNLVNSMSQDVFNHLIVSFTFIGDFCDRITSKNVKIVSISKQPGNSLLPFFKLRTIFLQNHIDIVHSRGWATMIEGVLSARLASVPVVIYGTPGKTYEDTIKIKKRRIIMQKILLHMTDGVVAYTQDMKKELVREFGVSETKIKIIKNGVDLNKVKATGNTHLREELGVQDGDIVIGAVGRIDPVKNYGMLVEAVHVLSKKYGNIKLILVGEGEDFYQIENQIVELGLSNIVSMLGKRDDIFTLLKSFDIFVQPSFYEGLSNTILESMSVGLPIVASNVGGNPEVVIEGENGLLFEPTDLEGLVKSIEKIYLNKSLRGKLGTIGQKKVQHEFSLNKMVEQYEQYYQGLFYMKTSMN